MCLTANDNVLAKLTTGELFVKQKSHNVLTAKLTTYTVVNCMKNYWYHYFTDNVMDYNIHSMKNSSDVAKK
jgi:hypothetical protein